MKQPMNVIVGLLFPFLLVGCGLTHKNHKADQTPLPTEQPQEIKADYVRGMELPSASFFDISGEKRCDALSEFMKKFVSLYMTGVSVEEAQGCWITPWTTPTQIGIGEPRIEYVYRPRLKNKGASLDLWVDVNWYLKDETGGSFVKALKDQSYDAIEEQQGDPWDQDALIGLKDTLAGWVKTPRTQHIIFGITFEKYVAAILKKFSAESADKSLSEDLGFILTPTAGDKTAGKVKFTLVSDKVLGNAPLSNASSAGFLGCSSMACLNDGSTTFVIQEDTLTLTRTVPSKADEPTNTLGYDFLFTKKSISMLGI